MLAPGTRAPEFTLSDKDGNQVSLSDFAGRKTVVYFYPKDCTENWELLSLESARTV